MLRSWRTLALAVAALAAALLLPASQAVAKGDGASGIRHVVFVGNNWDGTADGIYPKAGYKRVARINIVPDLQQRLLEIYTSPDKLGFFLAIRQLVGEGHDQFVDDMYSTPDGRLLIVSRPSLADVVGINSRPARSRGDSRWTATAPTTWGSPRTARRSPSRTQLRTSSTCWTPGPARSSASSPPATRRTRTPTPRTAH